MSQEAVELLRTATDAVNRVDVEAFVACFHPDVKWETSDEGFPGFEGTYVGHEGMRRWLKQTLEPWESVRLDVEEIIEPSHGRAGGLHADDDARQRQRCTDATPHMAGVPYRRRPMHIPNRAVLDE